MKYSYLLFVLCFLSKNLLGVRKTPPSPPNTTVKKSTAFQVQQRLLQDLLPDYQLPEALGRLFFSGDMKGKTGGASVLRGVLQKEPGGLIVLAGFYFDQPLDIMFSQKSEQLILKGLQRVADLAITVTYTIFFKDAPKVEVICSLVRGQQFDGGVWQPKQLKEYVAKYHDSLVLPDEIGLSNLAVWPMIRPQKKTEKSLQDLFFAQEDRKEKIELALEDLASDIVIVPVISGSWRDKNISYDTAVVPLSTDISQIFFVAQSTVGTLAQIVPNAFADKNDSSVMAQVRNFFSVIPWHDIVMQISPAADDLWGVMPGISVHGVSSFIDNVHQDPLLGLLTKQYNPFPIYLDQEGKLGIAAFMEFVCDPEKKEDAQLKMDINSSDAGLYFRMLNRDPYGAKNISANVMFNPFKLAGKAEIGFSYFGIKDAMQGAIELTADESGLGIVVSGAGDEDFTKPLEFLFGPTLVGLLGQKIIIRDLAFELRESWPALLAALPTAGLSLAALSSFGLSGGFELGVHKNPLRADGKIRGGLDLSSLAFELYYGSKSGWFPLVFFLLDAFKYAITFGHPGIVPFDTDRIQELWENLFPVLFDGFYLRVVPTKGSMGKIALPYGIGGNIQMRSFGKDLGVDLWIDGLGARAVTFVDPFNWGIFSLFPSKHTGPVIPEMQAKYNSLDAKGLKPVEWRQGTDKKIAIELFANENGLRVGTNVGVTIADTFTGSISGFYSGNGIDLQGRVAFQVPGIFQKLGVMDDSLVLHISGRSTRPDLFLGSKDALKEIILEVDFTNAFSSALQEMVSGAFDSTKTVIKNAVESFVSTVLAKTGTSEIESLRSERDHVCSEKHKIGLVEVVKDPILCGVLTGKVALLEGKNFALDNLENLGNLPLQVRTALKTLVDMGVQVLDGGKIAFDSLAQTFVIERVLWSGSLEDFSQGVLKNVSLQAKVFGIPIVLNSLTFDLFAPVKSFFGWISEVVRVVRNNLSSLVPALQEESFKKRLDELSDEAERAAEERLQEILQEETKKNVISDNKDEDLLDDGAWFYEKWEEISVTPVEEKV